MKKLLMVLVSLLMVIGLVACNNTNTPTEPEVEPTTTSTYKLGMGVTLSTASSKENQAQVDATFAAVVLDAEGKIVTCRLDVAQSKMDVTGGAVVTDGVYETKMELGDRYGMVAYGNAIAEWDAQAKAFESYVVGKTADEVASMPTVLNETGHNVTTDETLLATCTMDITEFIEAVSKACKDDKGMEFTTDKAFVLGVNAITESSSSKAATAEEAGVAAMYTAYGAAVVDSEGTVIAALNDATQPKIAVDANGAIGETTFKGTKRELGSDYGMVAYGNSIAEWDAQSMVFSTYCVGKTADQISGLETFLNESGHNVTTDETLLATCTMDIVDMKTVISNAAKNAR